MAVLILANSMISQPLPPGPSGNILLWTLKEFKSNQRWRVFAEWSKLYGDVIHTKVLGRSFVILNSKQSADDILVKQSTSTCGRPRFVMACELMGFETATALSQPNHFHRQMRRLMVPELSSRNSASRQPIELEERDRLLQRLESSPECFVKHIQRAVASVVLRYSYGHDVPEGPDPLVELINSSLTTASLALSGSSYLVDYLPFLKYIPEWFPGSTFKSQAREWGALRRQSIDVPFQEARQKLGLGIIKPCFLQSLLEQRDSPNDWDSEQVQIMKCAAASLYSAGADTTVSGLSTFMLLMVLFPEKQHKAQQELDVVLGRGRLPELNDQESLPYVKALVTEVLRWHPVLPLGLPHTCLEDVVYENRILPKGTTILPNIWAMTRDATMYPNPEKFIPERYLPKSRGGIHEIPAVDPSSFIFGFGRRACPGQHLATENLWTFAASILSAFDILPHIDESTGNPVLPPGTYGNGAVV
ncbi:cytochrome P450 family protein [Ceratobasidium sp. AG-Ba]|nr:cytochrome P450 family protein [Ceratobasidium sp. AG-Ba]